MIDNQLDNPQMWQVVKYKTRDHGLGIIVNINKNYIYVFWPKYTYYIYNFPDTDPFFHPYWASMELSSPLLVKNARNTDKKYNCSIEQIEDLILTNIIY